MHKHNNNAILAMCESLIPTRFQDHLQIAYLLFESNFINQVFEVFRRPNFQCFIILNKPPEIFPDTFKGNCIYSFFYNPK